MAESIGRSLQLLEYIATAPIPPSHAELQKIFNIPKSTLSGILREMRSLGYVVLGENGRYSSGPKFLSLTFRASQTVIASGSIRPVLAQIVSSTRETALFAVLAGHSAVYVDKIDSPEPIRYSPELGTSRPLHATAVGKVLLAWSDQPNLLQDLERLTPNTIIDRAALAEEIQRTREQGFAINRGESQQGVSAIAVPVHSLEGALLGAISAAGPSERNPDMRIFLPALQDALKANGFSATTPSGKA